MQKSSIIKLRDGYNTSLQFLETFQVTEKWVNYSDSFLPDKHVY